MALAGECNALADDGVRILKNACCSLAHVGSICPVLYCKCPRCPSINSCALRSFFILYPHSHPSLSGLLSLARPEASPSLSNPFASGHGILFLCLCSHRHTLSLLTSQSLAALRCQWCFDGCITHTRHHFCSLRPPDSLDSLILYSPNS